MSDDQKQAEEQPGTPTRDHQQEQDLDKRGQAVSDQQGENAPAGADAEQPEGGGND